ncbi:MULTISPECIES: acyl-CoA dehydrogenase family protein [Rhodococcus]|jgi:alkylation response protein AidB-like acyl-CoA dehydrogenase|uniref:Acyl-CoA dehydrogenase family protein n=2 Tax=Rhodococcus TaxID=1827 RepID=A0AAE5A933_9NOCA|nr:MULTISPECIES: acyl-CoA dehydrogenase family protein [Rhodococcus]MDV7242644.1 acyl-CoA dehydrogenase family protein [Rhodococcus oxybenzonivorans]MDV7268417.1 acyl-CoA dehydrogenase family protein [Rhodococcus oxybenzonivorans]MDV7276077.1 acyl-CoA dehydrogenase family protein [Rhodococcus oxybenzonivorans]MDV7332132.1 acyl-CoA dehydrogenase family protein [Rhodococcus oxybenzonivorans]MDV7344337.1 acyl-CoA dehydrogenase family protein [Rhodococcus oxybenzonivorans]
MADFDTESNIEIVRKATRELARKFDNNYWLDKDNKHEYPWDFIKAFADGGWLGAMIPEEYGGIGLGLQEAAVMMGEIASSGGGMSGGSAIHFYVFPPAPIVRYGSEEMKKKYLPKLASGEMLTAFGITEPTAGVDTSRIKTKATKVDGGWVINGQKVFITNAQNAHRILLLARTSPRRDDKPLHGMTIFFAELDPKHVTIREIDKLGRAAIDTNELFIDNLFVADEDVVGEVDKGFYYIIDGLNPERIVVAMEGIGLGRAALEIGTEYAKNRVVFDRPIGQNQAVAHPLADSWIRLEAAERMAMHAAKLFDDKQECGHEAAAAKYLGAEAGFEACDRVFSTLGGYAYAKEYHIERLWREVRLLRNAPFSQEMVRNYVSQQVLGLPRSY